MTYIGSDKGAERLEGGDSKGHLWLVVVVLVVLWLARMQLLR